MPVWNGPDQSFAAAATALQPHHVGAGSSLIDKHQPGGVKHTLLSDPAPAYPGDIRSFLFRRAPAFSMVSMYYGRKQWRVASWTSATLPVAATSKIISAVRSRTGRPWQNGSRSRIGIAASISVTRCEHGPRVRVIGLAGGRLRSRVAVRAGISLRIAGKAGALKPKAAEVSNEYPASQVSKYPALPGEAATQKH